MAVSTSSSSPYSESSKERSANTASIPFGPSAASSSKNSSAESQGTVRSYQDMWRALGREAREDMFLRAMETSLRQRNKSEHVLFVPELTLENSVVVMGRDSSTCSGRS